MRLGKKTIIWIIIGAILYFLLSYHFIFVGGDVKVLKKSHLTLNYTFFSTQGKTNEYILAIDDLREDGIADVLVEEGRMSEKERDALMEKYGYGWD